MTNIKSGFGGLNVIRCFYIMDFIINEQISFGTEQDMLSSSTKEMKDGGGKP